MAKSNDDTRQDGAGSRRTLLRRTAGIGVVAGDAEKR